MSLGTYSVLDSPIGELLLTGDDSAVTGIYLADHYTGAAGSAGWQRDDTALRGTREQLVAYFAGELREFDLPLAPVGTAFQQRVWRELLEIPYGCVRTYGDVAAAIGAPGAARAVGSANGRNPISIVIPCHRIVRGGGLLGGYGGGTSRKSWLLALEGVPPHA